ncbi:MAG: phenylalanine 4-monooxygenase [Bryobacteraceae bacterium]|nr:phenylalanine 4-monooxygenase [Bryobacteraceae bacterium]MDW8378862.1 phenylalanine 4-monooxygenase [Bryobacterales bacterium]
MLGLTTTQAPWIEDARKAGQIYISQPYELYSEENHQAWKLLYERMTPRWERYANPVFLDGLSKLGLTSERIPKLDEINRALAPLTGFRARAVSGYIPAFRFFESLRQREFPTTITIRPPDRLDYLPEPDIFHDVAGHVPMHTDRRFADTLVRFGQCAHRAAEAAEAIRDSQRKRARLESITRAMARFFWFTIEFGLIRTRAGLRAYGSGLLSSYGELAHALESTDVHRPNLQLDWVIHQSFEIDRYQPLLFVIDNFDQLYEAIEQLERMILDNRLGEVAPGKPEVDTEEVMQLVAGHN